MILFMLLAHTLFIVVDGISSPNPAKMAACVAGLADAGADHITHEDLADVGARNAARAGAFDRYGSELRRLQEASAPLKAPMGSLHS